MRLEERYDVGDEVMIKVKIANVRIVKGLLEYQVRVSDADPIIDTWFKKESLIQIEDKVSQKSKSLGIKIKEDLKAES